MTTPLPPPVDELAGKLARLPEATAVVLGGSRGAGYADDSSDWDLVVYYRGAIDLRPISGYGPMYPPGSWGRIMNGGAWFQLDGLKVDMMLRDLDVPLHWARLAEAGEFEVDTLLGYLAGIPTYSLAAELASGRLLTGTLPSVGRVPARLVDGAPPRWRFARDFSLEHACMHAKRCNVVGAVGQTAKATMEEAHARVCERAEWVLNEKHLLAVTGLDAVRSDF